MSMRVLWLRPSTGENISVRRERIAEKLEKRGFKVDIQDSSGLDALSAIWTTVIGNYDIIAGNVRMGLFIGYPLARILRKPFLGDVSDTLSDIKNLPSPLFRLLAAYEWFILERADASVFVYQSSYQEAKKRGVETPDKLPNAVDYEMFSSPNPEAVRESKMILKDTGVDLEKPMAVYIGIFTNNYQIVDILRASKKSPEWEFVFIGEGKLADTVETASDDQENVYYPGSFEYHLMPGFLSHADAGFCFKNAEQPLKLKEYGAAGIPAIAQPGELQRFYNDNELIFVEPDPTAISEVLTDISEGKMSETAENLRKKVKQHSWDNIADGYESLFNEMTGDYPES